MGFSSIASFMMLFFALIITVTTLVTIQVNLMETRTALSVQSQREHVEMNTEINILNISFDKDTDPQTTTMFISNIGSNKLNIDNIDVFIGSVMIPRNGNNRTINFVNNVINPLHWDSDEIIQIEVYLNMTNVTTQATVSTEYGIKDAIYYLG